jgi:hypothetical protein
VTRPEYRVSYPVFLADTGYDTRYSGSPGVTPGVRYGQLWYTNIHGPIAAAR